MKPRTPGAADMAAMAAVKAPTGKQPKMKMKRKVPQRDGMRKMATDLAKRFP